MYIITVEVSNEIAMATTEGTQIEVVDHGFNNSHENQAQALMQPVTKNAPLLDVKERQTCVAHFISKLKSQTIKSKSVVLILIWSFLTGALHWTITDPSSIITPLTVTYYANVNYYFVAVVGSVYVYFAILQLFYPLAGYLADVRYGRYKCVIGSLWCFVGSSLLMGIGAGLPVPLLLLILNSKYSWWSYTITSVVIAFLGPPIIVGVFVFFSSVVAFNANVIQFGLDQLHDSPTEHLIVFIHWYVLLCYVGNVIIKAPASTVTSLCSLYHCGVLLLSYLFLLISLCIAFCKRKVWFLVDPRSKNPYILVYKVISFAKQHKVPLQRSAFTYCEEELPSRLDLGKEKYGGPLQLSKLKMSKCSWAS